MRPLSRWKKTAPLVDGDWAEIQFRGEVKDLAQTVTEDGVTNASSSEPITGEDVLVEIGGKNTLAAFNEALRGAKPGQELKFEVDYPVGLWRVAGLRARPSATTSP